MKDKEQRCIFEDWIHKHKALLFKIVRAYAFAAEGRDDLFQEIAIQIWKSVPNFRNESAVTTWLYRISLNTAIRWKSKEKENIAPVLELDHYEEISKLNEIDRSLCLMLLDDFSHKEMTDIIGISENNVAVKINNIKSICM